MIKEYCFTDEWFDYFKKQNEHIKIDKLILEKMIFALHLLERLKKHELDFVFKGGTSLVLLLSESKRFSIDIDIICKEERNKLENIFDGIVLDSKFHEWQLEERRSYKEGVPKAHYKFFYESENRGGGSILLDVLIEDTMYPDIISVPISSKWIEIEEEILVNIPSIDCIVGDKLTAFAPNTIGIPYEKSGQSTSMEICKQLFDLSSLVDRIKDVKLVSRTYHLFAEKEIAYRQNELLISDTLSDTINTCLTIAKRGNGSELEKANFNKLQNGIKAFKSFLMSGVFRLDEAIAASARVAYIAAKLLHNNLSPLEKYDNQDISTMLINDPEWNFINRLKRLPDKSAFFYYYKTYSIMKT